MERNEPLIRWSPNPMRDEFMSINLNYRIVQVYQATGQALPGNFEYKKIAKHNEFPSLSAYDWSPVISGLVAVGNSRGEINLLRVDDNSHDILTLPLRIQRPCQSVAFNTNGLLAIGLDRVRTDSGLQIWDVNERLAGWNSSQRGWNGVSTPVANLEPRKLEASMSVTSIRFFEDQPQTLVVGIKNQVVRIHDLRDPSSGVISFNTKCNNNIAIDYADPNYFASSSLDQPGLVIWDRRATSRSIVSPMYSQSVEEEGVPWGAGLKLDRAIETQKNVYIRQLRYCRDQRGTLGVLSGAGQLQVFQTLKEYVEPGSASDIKGSPELLEVKKSHDLEYPYFDPNHKRKYDDRIVSFDWLSLGTSDIPGRVIALRANGGIEILQMPAATAGLLSSLIPWKPPHRLSKGYMKLMDFQDPKERRKVIGPLLATAVLAEMPLFGAQNPESDNFSSTVDAMVKKELQLTADSVIDLLPRATALPDSGKLHPTLIHGPPPADSMNMLMDGSSDLLPTAERLFSSQELHDRSHYSSANLTTSTISHDDLIDNVMLHRAKAGYLFDCKLNRVLVKPDRWLQDAWEWIGGAEEAAAEDGMVSGVLDLSYMGVYTIWNNLLGEKFSSRLIDSHIIPDVSQWETLIAAINKRAGRPAFDGVETTKPQHRQLCLAICGLVRPPNEFDSELKALEDQGKYTTAAAWTLFEGFPEHAVEILKNGGTHLLFIAMALDIKLKSNGPIDIDSEGWSKALRSHPQMGGDAYLRAIYGYITSGNWVAIANETALPLRDRVGVALRNFSDDQLTDWLSAEMEATTRTGDIEGIVLAGITDNMANILNRYVEKFNDCQTPILIMSLCYPRYITDARCETWRQAYTKFLQRHKEHILRVLFVQQSTKRSRGRDGHPVIKAPPRQVTIRCLKCDANIANDLNNTGNGPTSAPGPSSSFTSDHGNPLAATGINAGLCCPKCGSHLARCAICMEIVGMPRSDRPELSIDPTTKRMANFPSFCLKCKHVSHMDHAIAWFGRHMECPVPECRCQCNERPNLKTKKKK